MRRSLIVAAILLPQPVARCPAQEKEPTHEGKPLSRWVEQFRTARGDERNWAADAMGEMGPAAAAAVPVLVEALDDEDYHVSRALARIGAPALPALKAALGHEEAAVRSGAARALGEMGPPARTAVAALAERLKDRSGKVRNSAAIALCELAPDARAAVPALIRALADDQVGVPHWSAAALGRIGSAAKPAVPALLPLLQSPHENLRRIAATALGQIGPGAKDAVWALKPLLRDREWQVQHSAFCALVRIGPASLPVLREALADKDKDVRSGALVALGKLGAPAVPLLIETLGQEDVLIRASALSALGEIGPGAKAAVPVLLGLVDRASELTLPAAAALWRIAKHPAAARTLRTALGDRNWEVRLTAALAARDLGLETKSVVAVLAEALRRDPFSRRAALYSLFHLGKAGADAAGALAGVLESGDRSERFDAAMALGDVGSADGVPALVKALKDREQTVRWSAARALGSIGPPAKDAVRPLLAILDGKDERTKVTAAEALWRINRHPAAIPALTRAVEDSEDDLEAARALGSVGPDAAAAVPVLIRALENQKEKTGLKHGLMQRDAALALGQIGQPATKAVPGLRQALRHSHSDVRLAAAEALWRLEQDRSVVPILAAAVRHRESRDATIELLGRIGPAAEEAVPDLIYALKDDSPYTRTRAARALGQVGAKARAAIAALKDTLYADDPDERRAAALALKQIDPDATKGPSDR